MKKKKKGNSTGNKVRVNNSIIRKNPQLQVAQKT